MFFVAMGLVIPLVRTIYLSLHGSKGKIWVGLKNYGEILTNKKSLDLEDWTDIFGSRLTHLGVALLIFGLVAGALDRTSSGAPARTDHQLYRPGLGRHVAAHVRCVRQLARYGH